MFSPDEPAPVSVTDWTNALARLDLPPTVKAVGVRLALYGDYSTGKRCHPGEGVLADATGYGVRTIRRSLDSLRDLQLIVRTFEGKNAGRRGLADEYQLAMPADLLERVDLLPNSRERRR